MESVGTGWMLQPPKRNDDAAFNQLIEHMDMDQVRRMMCPKSNGNPKTCEKCDGFRTCKPGQRMQALMVENARKIAQNTAPVYTRRWPDPEDRVSNNPTSIEREEFRQACASGNAWNWLMTKKGLSREAAGELLSKLVRKYPNVSADYGGSRRIMQRPKAVRIESQPVEPPVDQEPRSEPAVEQTPAQPEKAPETAEKGPNRRQELNQELKEQARASFRRVLETGDPEQALVNEGLTPEKARSKLTRWRRNYPDLAEEYGLGPRKMGRPKKQVEEPMAEDEVSLTDFLNEMGVDEAPQEAQKQPEKADPMLVQMNARVQELTAEKERLTAEIARMEERIRCIEDQREALKQCIEHFER